MKEINQDKLRKLIEKYGKLKDRAIQLEREANKIVGEDLDDKFAYSPADVYLMIDETVGILESYLKIEKMLKR